MTRGRRSITEMMAERKALKANEEAQRQADAQRRQRENMRANVDRMHEWAQGAVAFAIMLKRRGIDPETLRIRTFVDEAAEDASAQGDTGPARLFVDTMFSAETAEGMMRDLVFNYKTLVQENGPIGWTVTQGEDNGRPTALSVWAGAMDGALVEGDELTLEGAVQLADVVEG